jgi:hypothetical protein
MMPTSLLISADWFAITKATGPIEATADGLPP